MKKLLGLVVVAAVVYGGYRVIAGPSQHGRARAACSNIIEMCSNGEGTQKDVAECTADLTSSDLSGGKKAAADKIISCSADANSCGEIVGCFAGASVSELGKNLDAFTKGFDRGFDRSR